MRPPTPSWTDRQTQPKHYHSLAGDKYVWTQSENLYANQHLFWILNLNPFLQMKLESTRHEFLNCIAQYWHKIIFIVFTGSAGSFIFGSFDKSQNGPMQSKLSVVIIAVVVVIGFIISLFHVGCSPGYSFENI